MYIQSTFSQVRSFLIEGDRRYAFQAPHLSSCAALAVHYLSAIHTVVRYTIPMPDDSPIPGRDAEEMALHSPVLSTVKFGGPNWTVGSTIFEMWLGAL